MRILFLGGTGNISAECASHLLELGHEITFITRGRTAVPGVYQSLQADRKDPASMREALLHVEPEVVLNFLGYELDDVKLDFELFQGRTRQYVFISSASIYAKPPPRLPLTEDMPLANPWWEYSQKKIACETWLRQQWEEKRFPVTIVRPSHTYSHLWVPNPVSSASYTFAARLERGLPVFVPNDGESPWTLTAAKDFARGLAGLAGNPKTLGEAFHITSDEALTWNQIVAEIADAVGASSPDVAKVPVDVICEAAPHLTGTLKGDKANPGVFDNSKLKKFVPGFQCRIPFHQGVRESVAWLRAHPERKNLNPKIDETCDAIVSAFRKLGSRPGAGSNK